MRHDEQQGSGPSGGAAEPDRRAIWAQSLSIAVATVPFGLAFGVASSQAGLALWQCAGFSVAVFAGSVQFAAVSVLAGGGNPLAAIGAGLLLALRNIAFGALVVDLLPAARWRRLLASHWVIDESIAIATAQAERPARRLGLYAAGGSIFVLWNLATIVGFTVVSGTGDVVTRLGIDGAVAAAFLALLWPRLLQASLRWVAALGAAITLCFTPWAPAGLGIIASAAAIVIDRELRASQPAQARRRGRSEPA